MKIEDLNISSQTGMDSCGRVFFYEGRILRAINTEAEQRVREFLSSELYSTLVENGWFVRTWIAEDVQLNGYPLIVECEKVYASQWQLFTFEHLREICVHAIKFNELCKQYGWVLSDVYFDNFGLKNGHICYFDLGGITKIGEKPELPQFIYRWKVLRLISLGLSTIARNTKDLLIPAYNAALYPTFQSKLEKYIEIFVFHPFGKKHDVYRKRSKPAIFSIRTRTAHVVINGFNRLAAFITKKSYPWRLLYVEPSGLEEKDFKRIKPYYRGYTDIEYLSSDVIKYFIKSCGMAKEEPRSVMLYGEYRVEDIELLRNSYKGMIWVCSPLLPYTDSIYKQIKEQNIDVAVLSFNLTHNPICDTEMIVELGLDCLLCYATSIAGLSRISEPTYYLGRLARCFNQIYMEDNGVCNTYVVKGKIVKLFK